VRWFLAINENATDFTSRAEQLQVAVATGQRYTDLTPHVLYDGGDNWVTRWLEERGVEVWRERSRFYDQIAGIAERRSMPELLQTGAGAMLRVELAGWAAARGVTDKFLLYTDLDVMFTGDAAALLERFTPRYFAAAPEENQDDPVSMNSGVMVMNSPRLGRNSRQFYRWIEVNLDRYCNKAWDQDAYNEFYRWGHRRLARKVTRRLRLEPAFLWETLPATLNWKPYWGRNPEARIVHFHGPKPQEQDLYRRGGMPDHLQRLATPDYYRFAEQWADELARLTS
jgi:hypothetical protein